MTMDAAATANNDEDVPDEVATLMSMGFDREQSIQALDMAGGNLENAIDSLLMSSYGGGGFGGGGGGGRTSATSGVNNNSTTVAMRAVHCNVSQYNNDTGLNGRSACTAIALIMGCKLLTMMNDVRTTTTTTTTTSLEDYINSDFLRVSIEEGIRLHHHSLVPESGVEHASVEELLRANSISSRNNNNTCDDSSDLLSSVRQFVHSPRQGILSNASFGDNPMGLETILSQCQFDAINQQSYIAVVITKPPETVLVLLPPPSSSSLSSSSTSTLSSSSHPYILLDSHPRPQQLSPHYPSGSYALYHSTLRELVASLQQIFPVVELGSDVPEMMAMMYNSFDAYPFQCAID